MQSNITVRRLISSGVWIFSLSGFTFLMNFIVNFFTANLIGPQIFGEYIFLSIIQGIIAIFTCIPINTVYIQKKDSKNLFDSCWYACAIASGVNIFFGLITSLFISNFQDKILLITLNINQVFIIYSGLYLATLEKKIEYKKISFLNIVSTFLSSAICILMLKGGLDILALITRDILYAILLLLGGIFLSRRFGPSFFNWMQIMEVLKSVINLTLMRGAESGYFRIPLYIFGLYYGEKNLGVFTQGIYLSTLQNAVLSPIIQGPIFSYISNLKNQAKEIIICNWTAIVLIIFAIAYFLLVKMFGSELFLYLYGNKWDGLDAIVLSMCLYSCFLPVFNLAKVILVKCNKQNIVTGAYLLNTLVLVISIILIYKFNLTISFQKILSLSLSITSLYMLLLNVNYISRSVVILYAVLLFIIFIVN